MRCDCDNNNVMLLGPSKCTLHMISMALSTRKTFLCNGLIVSIFLLFAVLDVLAFQATIYTVHRPTKVRRNTYHCAKEPKDDEDVPPGMAEAFRELDALMSLGEPTIKKMKIHSKSIDKPIIPKIDDAPEKEIQLYKDMINELKTTKEDGLYDTILADMGGLLTGIGQLIETDTMETDLRPDDTEELLTQALEEALNDIKEKIPMVNSDNILDNKEIMKEIEVLFDRGNKKLLENLEEIRKEQVSIMTKRLCTP
jgi:hypothetical protein